MSMLLEITDRDQSGVLWPELKDLLGMVTSRGKKLDWVIFDLEATGHLKRTTMLELEQVAKESPLGLRMSWDELISFAEATDQVIDGIFAGFRRGLEISAVGAPDSLYQTCDLVLQVIDSSLWRVYAKDEESFRDVLRTCKRVTAIPMQ